MILTKKELIENKKRILRIIEKFFVKRKKFKQLRKKHHLYQSTLHKNDFRPKYGREVRKK